MKIRAWLFISFWAVISFAFLHLGFRALENTELSDSVPPVIMFLFKHFLAVSSCFSSSYALIFRAQSRRTVRSNSVLLVYVFFSVVFRRTNEGIFIWHILKAILLKLKIFLGIILWVPAFLFGQIFRVPAFLFGQIFRVLAFLFGQIFRVSAFLFGQIFRFLRRRIMYVITIIIIRLLLQFLPSSSPLSLNSLATIIFSSLLLEYLPSLLPLFLNSLATVIFSSLVLFRYIYSHTLGWLLSVTKFLWFPILSFCWLLLFYLGYLFFYLGCLFLFCVFAHEVILICKSNFSELKARGAMLLVLEMSLFFVSATNKRNFSPILALSIAHLISVYWIALFRSGVVSEMRDFLSMEKEHRAKQLIEFAVGTVGAILFQNFFKINSFSEVAAFLYFAVMWLANLVLLGFCGDFGVFNFLLANAVVGGTVEQFGLHSATWVALGAALLLFAWHLELESIAMAYGEGQQIQFSFGGFN